MDGMDGVTNETAMRGMKEMGKWAMMGMGMRLGGLRVFFVGLDPG